MSKNRLLIELNSDKLKHTSRAREETEEVGGGGGIQKRERWREEQVTLKKEYSLQEGNIQSIILSLFHDEKHKFKMIDGCPFCPSQVQHIKNFLSYKLPVSFSRKTRKKEKIPA